MCYAPASLAEVFPEYKLPHSGGLLAFLSDRVQHSSSDVTGHGPVTP